MKIIAKIHPLDNDMVQLMSLSSQSLLAVVHVDHFYGSDTADEIGRRLNAGEELRLTIELSDKEA